MLCEILKEDGSPARMDDLELLAVEHDLAFTSIELLAQYIENNSNNVDGLDIDLKELDSINELATAAIEA